MLCGSIPQYANANISAVHAMNICTHSDVMKVYYILCLCGCNRFDQPFISVQLHCVCINVIHINVVHGILWIIIFWLWFQANMLYEDKPALDIDLHNAIVQASCTLLAALKSVLMPSLMPGRTHYLFTLKDIATCFHVGTHNVINKPIIQDLRIVLQWVPITAETLSLSWDLGVPCVDAVIWQRWLALNLY